MPFHPDQLISTARIRRGGPDDEFYRSMHRGDFVRVASGRYLPTPEWLALDADDRYRARVHGVADAARSAPLFGFESAAAMWRLPMSAAWPDRVHVIMPPERARSRRDVVAHAAGPVDDVVVEGVRVTSLARTVIDIARTRPLSIALPMADFALSERAREETGRDAFPLDSAELRELAMEFSGRGSAKLMLVMELMDGRSGSTGESVSRGGFHVLKVPPPELQHEFRDRQGSMFSDFWWPEFRVFGEFDGLGKYVKPELLRPGETTADAVIREKKREDRIRALPPFPRSARWDWSVARSLPSLAQTLRDAGIRF